MNKDKVFEYLCDTIEARNSRTATQTLRDFYKDRALVGQRYIDYCAEKGILIDVKAIEIESHSLQNKMIDIQVLSII
jgi:hypothetical protein